jgi:hypothetical protein
MRSSWIRFACGHRGGREILLTPVRRVSPNFEHHLGFEDDARPRVSADDID